MLRTRMIPGARALATLICVTCLSRSGAAPIRFGFDWDSAWRWEELARHVAVTAPEATGALERVRARTPERQARILYRLLSELPDFASTPRLADRAAIDRRTPHQQALAARIAHAFAGAAPRIDLAGMLDTASRLSEVRAAIADPFLPEPGARAFAIAPVPRPEGCRVAVRVEPQLAETLVDRLTAGSTSDAAWTALAADPAFQQLSEHAEATRLTPSELVGWWQRAQNPEPLNRLYEWVYPGSYYDFGGVAAYAEIWRDLLARLRSGAAQLSAAVEARVADRLPTGLAVQVRLRIMFGATVDGWTGPDAAHIHIEHFGDDWERLALTAAHECFHRSQHESVIPVLPTPPQRSRAMLVNELLTPVFREGFASLVGPPWGREPTSDELRTAFAVLNSAFQALYVRSDGATFRRLVRTGMAEAGAIYRAGWQMARTIEQRQGRGAVRDLQALGPAAFFGRYSQICATTGADAVPAGYRLSQDFAAEVLWLAGPIDAPATLEAMVVGRATNRARAVSAALRLLATRGTSRSAGLGLVLAGDRLARQWSETGSAGRLIAAGIRHLEVRADDLVRREGMLLLSLHDPSAALAVFRAGVEACPGVAARHFLLGEGLRATGDLPAARAAYGRALQLEPGNSQARAALTAMGPP